MTMRRKPALDDLSWKRKKKPPMAETGSALCRPRQPALRRRNADRKRHLACRTEPLSSPPDRDPGRGNGTCSTTSSQTNWPAASIFPLLMEIRYNICDAKEQAPPRVSHCGPCCAFRFRLRDSRRFYESEKRAKDPLGADITISFEALQAPRCQCNRCDQLHVPLAVGVPVVHATSGRRSLMRIDWWRIRLPSTRLCMRAK